MKQANKRVFTWFGMAVMAMGLLISARLLLVTGHPRRAIADPAPTGSPTPPHQATGAPAGAALADPHRPESSTPAQAPDARPGNLPLEPALPAPQPQ
jgi:hypothetical protein